jgi:hypothetical protein
MNAKPVQRALSAGYEYADSATAMPQRRHAGYAISQLIRRLQIAAISPILPPRLFAIDIAIIGAIFIADIFAITFAIFIGSARH